MSADLSSFALDKRSQGVPWPHIANMAGCPLDSLRPLMASITYSVQLRATPAPAPAPRPDKTRKTRKTDRRAPGGLMRAVLLLVGDGYPTSLQIARVLDISIDNANGALSRLSGADLIRRKTHDVPVQWVISEAGYRVLRDDLQWVGDE